MWKAFFKPNFVYNDKKILDWTKTGLEQTEFDQKMNILQLCQFFYKVYP